MPESLTRRELYDLVWSKAVSKVAEDLGISGVAVKKICDRHRVPVPGRGYWAKLAAGQKVKPAAFREVSDPVLNRVQIRGSLLNALPQEVLVAREKARSAPTSAPPTHSAVQPLSNGPELPDLVDRLKRKLEAAKPDHNGLLRVSGPKLLACAIAPASIPRLLLILTELIRQGAAKSYTFVAGEPSLTASVDGEVIDLELIEGTEKVRHQATESEIAGLERWEANKERAQRRGQWFSDWDKPKVPEWDWIPNGRLALSFDKGWHSDGLRRKFGDGSRQRIELLIPEIFIALATCAAAKKAKREADQRRKEEWARQEEMRREAQRRQTLDAKRAEFLYKQMERADAAARIEAFTRDYTARHRTGSLPPGCTKLLEWANEYAQRIRDSISPSRLDEVINRHSLMDEATDIGSWVKFD
jgi:hypothetical protein